MTDILDRFDHQLIEAAERRSAAAPSHRRRHRLRHGMIALVAVGLTGSVAVAATTLNQPGPSVSAAPSEPVLDGFSALRGAPIASPADTAAIQRNLDNRPGESQTGADLLPFVVQVSSTAEYRSIVAIGPKYVCLQTHAAASSGSACTTHAVASNPMTPMVDVTIVGDGYLVSALLPDGVSAATLETKSGSRRTLALARNFARATVPDPPDHLTLTTTDGPATVSLAAIAAAPTGR